MNQLDLFLGAVVLLFALGGLFGGAVRRVIQIAALIIAFREAWRLAPWVESVLGGGDGQSIGGWGFIVPLIAFALIYIGIRLVGNWFSSLTKGTFLSVIDRIVGLVLGLLVGVYLMGYACLLFEGISPMEQYNASSSTPPTTRQSSYLYPRLMQSVEDIRHAKSLLFGGDDSKTTDTKAPAEATPTSK
ncbi:MAG: CvpA family protein [Porphyromonadaceae bacterium]|jgi:colicin V production protein|nr:CvpA family protein [Porphyromonadaceae bacterium]